MRLTKRTNLAMRVLMFCAVNTDRNVTKSQIASGCNSSENHLGHVVNRLGQLGFLETIRGRRGGIRLARPANGIWVGDVFRAMETGVPLVECMDDAGEISCPLYKACRLRGELRTASEAFFGHLDQISLAELVEENAPLNQILDANVAA